jgi:glucokinase
MRGCFEAMASGTAIARDARERIASGTTSIIGDMIERDLEKITAATVEQAARQGDELAKDVMHRAAVNLGIGLSNLIIVFDPQAVVVGGGVTKSDDLIFEPARKTVAERVGRYFGKNIPILKAALGDNVGLIGAAALVLDNV